MLLKEDNTYNEIREKSVRQWLADLSAHDDIVVRGGVKVTSDYIDYLQKQIRLMEEKCALRDEFLKKMKDKAQ